MTLFKLTSTVEIHLGQDQEGAGFLVENVLNLSCLQ